MMIENRDITVVIQGPVVASTDREMEDGITAKAIASVRQFLPGSHIILSTWKGQPIDGLDVDDIILSDDPGNNVIEYRSSGEPVFVNENRQIVSSRNGLKRVITQYAIKLRSDNVLTSDNFKSLFEKYPVRAKQQKLFKERVVINSLFTREISRGFPSLFHVSDFFYFGLTEDLLKIWDIPLFTDFIQIDKSELYAGYPYHRLSCEQRLFLSALKHSFGLDYNVKFLTDYDRNLKKISKLTFANNFVVASADQVGLGLSSKFISHRRFKQTSQKITYLDYFRWRCLYQEYCDNNFEIKHQFYLKTKLSLLRLFFIPPKSIQTWFKVVKRKFC